jgi:hypothetical protein
MKTEKLPAVPAKEPGDFYYRHLKLPNALPPQAEEHPFEPDPAIEDMMDISSDTGDQLGFVILKKDNTVEVVDALTGQHVRIIFGTPKRRRKSP